MRIAHLTVAGLALLGNAALGAEPDDSIVQLASRSYAEREAAAKALDALGTVAIPALHKARAESSNPEVQLRVNALIARIQRRADSIAAIQAKPVSFDFKDRPLSSAIADLRLKTGIPLVLDPSVKDSARPITLKVDELPPWLAIERFCEAAGLRDILTPLAKPEAKVGRPVRRPARQLESSELVPSGVPPLGRPDELPILLVDGKNSGASDSTGGLRIRALPLTYTGSGADRNAGEVKLHFDVAPQPGLNWIHTKEIRIGRATSSTGRELSALFRLEPVPSPFAGIEDGIAVTIDIAEGDIATQKPTRTNARAVPVTFKADERDGKSLRNLEGLIVGEVSRANRPILTIDDFASSGGQAFDCQGTTLTVVSITSDAKSGSTKLVLRIGGQSNFDGVQQAMPLPGMRNRLGELGLSDRSIKNIRYYDAEGRVMKQPVQQAVNSTNDGFSESTEFTLRFGSASSNVAPKPVKLVVWGTEIVTVEVPFKLKDVPLE